LGRLCCFILLAVIALAAPATAQTSRLDDILARGVLRVGTTGDYRPFTALDKASGAYSGFDIDLAQSLGAALGVKVEFEPTSWPNLTKDFEAGAFDIAMGGVSVTLDRAKKGFFSTPYLREGKTPIARCADKDKYQRSRRSMRRASGSSSIPAAPTNASIARGFTLRRSCSTPTM